MTKRLIIVAGNIGVGKTSLAERLAERLGWRCASNPWRTILFG
jgi:deoxyadenosine/deoxycytidine kinase